jgi:hypothetical protein
MLRCPVANVVQLPRGPGVVRTDEPLLGVSPAAEKRVVLTEIERKLGAQLVPEAPAGLDRGVCPFFLGCFPQPPFQRVKVAIVIDTLTDQCNGSA